MSVGRYDLASNNHNLYGLGHLIRMLSGERQLLLTSSEDLLVATRHGGYERVAYTEGTRVMMSSVNMK